MYSIVSVCHSFQPPVAVVCKLLLGRRTVLEQGTDTKFENTLGPSTKREICALLDMFSNTIVVIFIKPLIIMY